MTGNRKTSALELLAAVMAQMEGEKEAAPKPVRPEADVQTIWTAPSSGK